METIAQEAKRILEPIPEDLWLMGLYGTYNRKGCRCFLGHWNEANGGNPDYSSREGDLNRTIGEFLNEMDSNGLLMNGFDVNDGGCTRYQEETPKQRVMALLDDMINAGY